MVSVFPVSYNQLNEVVSIRKFCKIFQPFLSQELVLLLWGENGVNEERYTN